MKKFLMVLCAVTLIFGILGSANALTISGSLWSNVATDSSTSASYLTENSGDLETTLGTAHDTFTVDKIDFEDYDALGTYLDFLNGPTNANTVTGLTSLGAITTTTSSTTGFFLQLEGTMYFENGATFIHDDGMWLQLSDGTIFDWSTPTSPKTETITGITAGTYDFVLNYSAWNGNPEVLQYSHPVNPVPEPATFLLFGLGILGIAGASRKKQK